MSKTVLFQTIQFSISILFSFRPAHWLSGRVFANGLGDRGSISGLVIPKT